MTSNREHQALDVALAHLTQAVRELAVAVRWSIPADDPESLSQRMAHRAVGDAVRHLRQLGAPHYSDADPSWDALLDEFPE